MCRTLKMHFVGEKTIEALSINYILYSSWYMRIPTNWMKIKHDEPSFGIMSKTLLWFR